jgi:hypothetical protein
MMLRNTLYLLSFGNPLAIFSLFASLYDKWQVQFGLAGRRAFAKHVSVYLPVHVPCIKMCTNYGVIIHTIDYWTIRSYRIACCCAAILPKSLGHADADSRWTFSKYGMPFRVGR